MKKDNLQSKRSTLARRDGLYSVRLPAVMGCTKKGLIPSLRKRGGFTMAEILVALTILTIGLVSILSLFPVGLKASKRAGDLNEVALCAQEIFEGLRLCVYDDVDPGRTNIEDIPGVNTNVYARYLRNSGYVVSSVTGYTNLKEIDLTIRWVDAGRTNEEKFITYRADYE